MKFNVFRGSLAFHVAMLYFLPIKREADSLIINPWVTQFCQLTLFIQIHINIHWSIFGYPGSMWCYNASLKVSGWSLTRFYFLVLWRLTANFEPNTGVFATKIILSCVHATFFVCTTLFILAIFKHKMHPFYGSL